jgi:UDP-GlcNAc:undecaprenyl-phosphate/decaprenyl-phosphate GlcNAc-1-phosphate transferase
MFTEISQLFFAIGATFIIGYYLVPLLIKVAYHKNLYDKPDGKRKVHDRFIPALGGVSIFVAFFVGFSMSGFADDMKGYPYMAAAAMVLFFTGLKDDLIGLSPAKKLAIQVVLSLFVIFGCVAVIDNFYGLFGLEAIPLWIAVPVTVFTMIVIMNSYNLIDGIDGLAAGVGIIASLLFCIGFMVADEVALAIMSLFAAASLAAFLIHNFRPASIFMGDSGSLVIGFLLAFLAIRFVGLGGNPAYVEAFGNSSPVFAVLILIVPLYDTLRVFVRRLLKKRSPFMPGMDHIHHVFLKYGRSHRSAALYLYGSMIFIAMVALSLRQFDQHAILAVSLLVSVLILPTNGSKRRILNRAGMNLKPVEIIKVKKVEKRDVEEVLLLEEVRN